MAQANPKDKIVFFIAAILASFGLCFVIGFPLLIILFGKLFTSLGIAGECYLSSCLPELLTLKITFLSSLGIFVVVATVLYGKLKASKK